MIPKSNFLVAHMASELIEYRGYELHIELYESGFKARIRKSGSLFDRPELPYSENKTQREQMIAEAMAIVDTLLDAPQSSIDIAPSPRWVRLYRATRVRERTKRPTGFRRRRGHST